VKGTVRLAGAETSIFQSPSGLARSYVIVSAAGGIAGKFDTSTAVGLPSFVSAALGYEQNNVTLDLTVFRRAILTP
jgi:subtilase-type serine protease